MDKSIAYSVSRGLKLILQPSKRREKALYNLLKKHNVSDKEIGDGLEMSRQRVHKLYTGLK